MPPLWPTHKVKAAARRALKLRNRPTMQANPPKQTKDRNNEKNSN